MVSFATVHTSISAFLIELETKIDFWNEIASKDSLDEVSSFWLPAFFSPKTFLHSLGQTRSRNQMVPITDISNQYEVQTFMTTD